MDAFRELQVLVLVALVVAFAPMVAPPLRPHSMTLKLAALVIYLVGAAAVLAKWLLTRE